MFGLISIIRTLTSLTKHYPMSININLDFLTLQHVVCLVAKINSAHKKQPNLYQVTTDTVRVITAVVCSNYCLPIL
jgi:hypothetical protein